MDIQQRIAAFTQSEMDRIQASAEEPLEESIEPVDVYQRNRDRAREVGAKSFPNGSSSAVTMAVNFVIDGAGAEGLAQAYSRAKEDYTSLNKRGETGRAEIRRKQYMDEFFLPAVEAVVNSTSPDEVLANKRALSNLDKYVLLGAPGRGYTATYIRQSYGNQLGRVEGRSDASVRSGVRRLNSLLDNGNVRAGFALANELKKKIDAGENIADDNDFELISRVVAYYS